MASTQEIVSKIQKQSKLDVKKIETVIDEKYEEFSGMITREAAAHLIARDMGIDIPKSDNSKLQLKNIVPGMRNVNVTGRIFKTSPINEFKKKSGDTGKVVNIFIADGTGYMRIPLWNDQVKIIEEEFVKIGDAIQVLNGMSKENIYGEVEISVGKFGGIKKLEDDESVPSLDFVNKNYFSSSSPRMKIAEIVPGKSEIKGTIVQLFKGNFLFESDGGEKGLVVSCVVDDGTGDIRVVFFRNVAEELSRVSAKELDKMSVDERFALIKRNVVGKEIIISGTVKNSKYFKTLEIIADSVKDLNPLEESKRIAEELEAKIGV